MRVAEKAKEIIKQRIATWISVHVVTYIVIQVYGSQNPDRLQLPISSETVNKPETWPCLESAFNVVQRAKN